jgi:hypothetical protein
VLERLGQRDIPIADLTFFPGNARRGNVAKIRESVRRLGQYRSVVVRDTGDALVILAGNHTVRALRAERHETAACDVVRCSDDDARRVNLADNRLSDIAEDDPDDLVQLLSYLDGDYAGTGWEAEDVAKLLEPGPGDGGEGDAGEDDLPATWGVVAECPSEAEQAALLESLDAQGYKVRALMT